MLVLNEKLPIARSALWGMLGVLVSLALIGPREVSEASAEGKGDALLPKPAEGAAPTSFDEVERDVVVSSEEPSDRAFMYAPPPMPHAREDVSQGECLSCHAPVTDIKKRWRAIRPVPHALYSQCMQCHVSQERGMLPLFAESEFIGLAATGNGSQAHAYAPPTVPHKVFMRENCLSCHGSTGYADIKTSHPERSQCLQCHVGEAAEDYTRIAP